MIRLQTIRKRFGALDVLQDVSLALRSSAVTALVGPNGSGKTTLIKIVLGLTRADQGTLHVGGQPADEAGDYRRAIGYMPQAAHFPVNLRVGDVLDLVAQLRPGETVDDDLARAYDMAALKDKFVGTLSGGTKQKVNAVIAFMFRPSLLILDEPTAGLDPLSSNVLKEKVRAVRAEGRTVLVTSHIMTELESLADDVAFLCDGRLRYAGSIADLLRTTDERSLEEAVAALMRAERAEPRYAAPEVDGVREAPRWLVPGAEGAV
ncbi:MAG: ABC transporter ATP-binding protein [Gemmatimonadetes bacterium]|nr:ABC transporter ATP-binding protein [Gemmatimonadota bacterium]